MMGRRIRFAAVLAVVVLALTGFQTSSHGGTSGGKSRGGSSGSSGGGCSNSKKSNGGYSNHSGNSGNGSSGSTATASAGSRSPEVRVLRCAEPARGERKAVTAATVQIRSTATTSHTYAVSVTFTDAAGTTVDTGRAAVTLAAGASRTVSVRMDDPQAVSRVERCLVRAEQRY